MSTLTTNGLEVSPHFPTSEYESINSRVQKHWSTHNLYNHFSGSWNALAYRFHGTVHSGENFVASLKKYGTAPTPFERYLQEQALFVFFGGAFSALESLFYGSFAIGAFLNSPAFPLDTPRDQQRVSPSQTIEAFKKAFPANPILNIFDSVTCNPSYLQLREIRNVLTHRTAPGRTMYLSIGSEESLATEWKLNNIPIDQSLVSVRIPELGSLLRELLKGIDEFLVGNT